ncbi:MAG: cellulose synthase/poly-beta-1,6-N-acetylglucosamine synthase-like glycosyltransferase [Sphingobacteriales bacterium]
MELTVKLFWFLLVLYSLIITYFLLGWFRLKKPNQAFDFPKISVLIPARNEELRLGPCLDSLMLQTYPKDKLEIIVIDDHSEDGTSQLARSYGVKVIEMKDINTNSYKKLAIEKGVAQATGEYILTTDADCYVPENWAKKMVSYFLTENAKFIAGPVAYHNDNSIFEKLQHLEFLALIGVGAGGIGQNFPMFCNGANLGFHRDSFLGLDGFKGIDDIASGDDELLLHRFSRSFPNQISFVKSSEAIVLTEAVSSMSKFINQRRRWASKSTRHKNNYITLIAIITFLLNLLIALFGLFSVFSIKWIFPFVIGLLSKTMVELPLIYFLTKFSNRRALLWWLPFEQFFYVFYIVLIAPAGLFGKYNWKGRKVK